MKVPLRIPAAAGLPRPPRLKGLLADPLLRSAYSLMLNVVLTSALGVGFWIVAARLFTSATIGRDGALVSAMLVVSTVCQLNFSSVILRFLPISKLDPVRGVLAAYGLTAVVSLLGGSLFVFVAPHVSGSYRFLAHDPVLAVLYVLAVAAWGVFALQDSVLTAMRRAPWVPLENGAFGVLKIAALPLLLALNSTHAVFIAWVVPMVLLVIPVNYVIFVRMMPRRVAPPGELSPVERFGRRGLARFMVSDYVATIFLQAGSTLLPVVVIGLVGTSRGAYFYMPFTIVSAFDLLFVNTASSMTVEASMAHHRLGELVRASCRRFGPLLLAGVAVLVAAATLVLLPYGPAYVRAGAPVLRLLALASLFRAVVSLYAAICRVDGRAERVMGLYAVLVTLTMGLTVALTDHGSVTDAAYAWLIANAVVGFAVLPLVARRMRAPAAEGIEADRAQGGRDRFVLFTVTEDSAAARSDLAVLLDSLERQQVTGDLVVVMRGGGLAPRAPAGFRVHVVESPRRIALSRARNLALGYAAAHGLLEGPGTVSFPDDDASYAPGLLEAVLSERDCGLDVVCGPYAPSPEEVDWRRFPPRAHALTPELVMRAGSSSTAFFALEVIRAVGHFDERLGLGAEFGAGEDSDYLLRVLRAGFRARYRPSLIVTHPYKTGRPAQYYRGNVAVLAKHVRGGGTSMLLARRLASGLLLAACRRLGVAEYGAIARTAVRLTLVPGGPGS